MDIKQVREEIDYAGDHPLEFPLVHTAEWLLVQLEASQQQLAAIEHLATSPTDRWDELEEWLDKTGYINEGFLLRCNRERNILRAKLAEARLENTKLGSKLETAKTHRKISEAEVKRLKDQLADCYDEHPYIVGG